jgi:hypothetical protein
MRAAVATLDPAEKIGTGQHRLVCQPIRISVELERLLELLVKLGLFLLRHKPFETKREKVETFLATVCTIVEKHLF